MASSLLPPAREKKGEEGNYQKREMCEQAKLGSAEKTYHTINIFISVITHDQVTHTNSNNINVSVSK